MIIGVSADRMLSVWHEVAPLLKRAFDRVDYPFTMEEIAGKVNDREMQLWMTHDASTAWLTRILEFPRYKVLEVIAGGGEGLDEWLVELDQLLTAFASHHGCKYVECQGRKGWQRVAGPLGYTPVWVTIRKEV